MEKEVSRMTLRQEYPGVDICKLIAAMLIVVLHAIEIETVVGSGIKWSITRFAVPFFLIASGFFFRKGLEYSTNQKEYFVKYERRLLTMFLIWAVLLTGFSTVKSYIVDNSQRGVLYVFFVLIRRMFVIGPTQYWYLVTLIYSTAYIYFCVRVSKEWMIAAGAIFGFVLEIAYSCFRGVLQQYPLLGVAFSAIDFVFSWEYNFITFGIPLCAVGYYIAKKQIRISLGAAIVMFALATILRVMEYVMPMVTPDLDFWDGNRISVMFILQAVAFFFIGVNWNAKNADTKRVRQLSTLIYCMHCSVLYSLLDPLFGTLFPGGMSHTVFFVCAKVLLTLIICTVSFVLIVKINNKYLNLLLGG